MNNIWSIILEILKFTIPTVIVIIALHSVISKFLKSETQRRQFEVFKNGQDITLRLRLQAYERLALFLERLHLRSLMTRSYQTGMTVRDFQVAMIQNIQMEYDHNVSQQVYVNYKLWKTIQGVKEQTQMMVNEASSRLHPEDSAKALQKALTEMLISAESMPLDTAIEILHTEAKLVLQQQV
ncbi:MAG: hypothetical protein BGO09_02860 [Bacteroidetes bacterium 47-18]|nr:MAG: hypothetical protein BGO09_02860 [Bacteroidetes bacterium 47-18]